VVKRRYGGCGSVGPGHGEVGAGEEVGEALEEVTGEEAAVGDARHKDPGGSEREGISSGNPCGTGNSWQREGDPKNHPSPPPQKFRLFANFETSWREREGVITRLRIGKSWKNFAS